MAFPLDGTSITHGIQLAVAPVFLLTAVAGMIGAVAGRLARIIDRGRTLDEKLRVNAEPALAAHWVRELAALRQRGLLANTTIGLLTLCAFVIGLTIVLLFLGETTAFKIDRYAIYCFLAGVLCFMAALGCFVAETLLAARVLKFRQLGDD
jgi:hypothetical protein